jgi:antagonist of KipI
LHTGDHVRFVPTPPVVAAKPPHRSTTVRPRPHVRDAFEVLEPGLQTTVQDLGRPGHGRMGVAPGGALDKAALIRGNRLVGNPDGAAGVEMTLTAPRLRFLRPGRMVITGADLGACLNGTRLLVGAMRVVGPGDELSFRHDRARGARAYLCLSGGIDVPIRLGSRSTDLVAGFGGFEGRALQAGDRLRVISERHPFAEFAPPDRPRSGHVVRVVRGPQAERFDESAFAALFSQDFTISPQSNRLGLRLDGHPIFPIGGADIISEGMVTGAIQVTGQGQPIVMLPSRATIGGYPKIGTVIAADLDLLGQLRPGGRIRFEEVILPGNEG